MDLRQADPEPILIEDYTASGQTLWAADVGIPSYKLIADSYVAYSVILLTRAGTRVSVYRRYSEFEEMRSKLVLAKPLLPVPEIPPKTVFAKFDPTFVESRRRGLEYFLKCVVLNPELSDTRVVKDFFE